MAGNRSRLWLNDLELSCGEADELGAFSERDLLISSVDDNLLSWHGLSDHLSSRRQDDSWLRWRLGDWLDQLSSISSLSNE